MKNITYKQDYKTPIIDVEELEKYDILTTSDADNVKTDAYEISGGDLFSSIVEDLSGS